MNNDADLNFIAVWQQMLGFSNIANLFDLDGGPYSYLDFKSDPYQNLSSIYYAQFKQLQFFRDIFVFVTDRVHFWFILRFFTCIPS